MNSPETLRVAAPHIWPLHDVAQTRRLEHTFAAQSVDDTLMERAGRALAQWALALAPHAANIWIACGPGNNGGDGFEAAVHLKALGKNPIITWMPSKTTPDPDALKALHKARAAHIPFESTPPKHCDLVIDALLGIGLQRPPQGEMVEWIAQMHRDAPILLCVDTPSGLMADTGEWLLPFQARCDGRTHTLSLLTLKPGLFTAHGRDAAGQVWFNRLGMAVENVPPVATLQTSKRRPDQRRHNSHKGTHGDVIVLGGASGMTGAAWLSATSALHGGAGRVWVSLLDANANATPSPNPALMQRAPDALPWDVATAVCGCGGGQAVTSWLPRALSTSPRLVLDADALNAIATDRQLLTLLQGRHRRGLVTVITPHPLEAARLLGLTPQDIQKNRLQSAQSLIQHTQAWVVLKGSGTVIGGPDSPLTVNHSGNAKLATAGTGDVLAGLIGAYLCHTDSPFEAICDAVWVHGHQADTWPTQGHRLTAADLAIRVK